MRSLLPYSIALVDIDTGAAGLDLIAGALTVHLARDFMPRWFAAASGAIISARAVTAAKPWQPGGNEWRCELRAKPVDKGALAEHMRAPDGSPILLAYPLLCAQDGSPLSAGIGHEVDEALADPLLCRGAQRRDGTWFALEVDDATQAQTYAINGIEMPNFCTPAWFEPMYDVHGNPQREEYDFLGKLSHAFEVADGGYAQTWDQRTGWQMIGAMTPGKAQVHDAGVSRFARRISRMNVAA